MSTLTRLLTLPLVALSLAAVAQTRPPAPSSLSYLRGKAGLGPWDLWKTEPLRRRLLALLGPTEFKALQFNMNPASSMELTGNILSSIGNGEHMGTVEEGALIVDLDRDIAEVLILHDGKTVRAWAERNQFVPLPPSIQDRVKDWPQPMVRQALASLQQSSSAAAQPSAARPAASQPGPAHASSTLDDIASVFGGGDAHPSSPAPAAARTGAAPTATSLAPSGGQLDALGRQLEVSGLKIGMPAAQAAATAASLLPKALPRVTQFSLTDLPGFVMTSGANYFQINGSHASENIVLGYTLSPKLAALWGLERKVEYPEDELPSVSATIAALRAKYGPESSYTENPIVHERTLIWLRDGSGNPVPKGQAAIIAEACGHLGVATQSSQTDITNGWEHTIPNQVDCSPYTFLNATLVEWESTRHDSQGRFKPAGLLFSLKEDLICYPLRRASYEATTAVVEAARHKREADELKKAKARSAPL